MFDEILKSIRQFGKFSEQEQKFFTDKLKIKTFKKGELLLQTGQVCKSIYFIRKGAFRHYAFINDKTELTLNLFTEDDWVFDQQSFTSQKPSENFIQAFEESKVLELDVLSLHKLVEQSKSFFVLGKLLKAESDASILNKNIVSPEKKYNYILTEKPLLLNRFPLKYIASYLRITPETLSRIRKKVTQ